MKNKDGTEAIDKAEHQTEVMTAFAGLLMKGVDPAAVLPVARISCFTDCTTASGDESNYFRWNSERIGNFNVELDNVIADLQAKVILMLCQRSRIFFLGNEVSMRKNMCSG